MHYKLVKLIKIDGLYNEMKIGEKMNFKTILKTSLFKTIRFNYRYWGLSGLVKPKALISHSCVLKKMEGQVVANRPGVLLRLGYGTNALIDKNQRCIWNNTGTVILNGHAFLEKGTRISCGGELSLGENLCINGNTTVIAEKKVSIGDDCIISWNSLLMDTDYHYIFSKDGTLLNENKEIVIGNHVWIGCNTAILKGTTIPDGCIVAAGSTVRKAYAESNAVIAECGVIKRDIHWKREI